MNFSIFEAILFLFGIVIFLSYSIKGDAGGGEKEKKASWRSYLFLVLGGVLVWLGANYTIEAISKLSEIAGIDPEIIQEKNLLFYKLFFVKTRFFNSWLNKRI